MSGRRHALDLAVLLVIATTAAAAVFVAQPGLHAVVARAWALAAGALVMTALVSAATGRLPGGRRSELDAALAATAEQPPARPAQLARLEREVTLAVATSHDLHAKLLPQLREIAAVRLGRRGRRISPATVGRWWELLRPDREPPEDRFAPGIREDDLRALVDELESM
ncbi:MAG TPA: hypothetical protein VFA82_05960 [Gaiellaceae bacterium]|nr:hypothetical protein [Gaiellaceae bacterium]